MYQYNRQNNRYSGAKPIDIKTHKVAQTLGKQPDQVLKLMIYELYAQVEDLHFRLDQAKKAVTHSLTCTNCEIHIVDLKIAYRCDCGQICCGQCYACEKCHSTHCMKCTEKCGK